MASPLRIMHMPRAAGHLLVLAAWALGGACVQAADVRRMPPPSPFVKRADSLQPARPQGASPTPAQVARVQQQLKQLHDTVAGTQDAAAHDAAWLLGLVYWHGAGVAQNKVLAATYFEQAVQTPGPQTWGYAGLAWCHVEGCRTLPDQTAAMQAIASLRATHPARADYLAWLVEYRSTPFIAMTSDMALSATRLLQAAADAGDAQALMELGAQAYSRQRLDEAAARFEQAAKNSATARANLAMLKNLDRQNPAASGHIRPNTASRGGEEDYQQARKYHTGSGRPFNYSEAIRLYMRAADKGHAAARRMLQLIYSRPGPDGGVDIVWMRELTHANVAVQGAAVSIEEAQPLLRRDPSPLFDLLPVFWQNLVPAGTARP